ncbi:FAD-binding domain-containing protein [Daldinia decipiens]|uniref:FAD-binding domain-containing protein n=1 Tax=Daldinia decipiens TaxID=326647 RepID=UPI0020C1BEB7|nr:FAD-binding domain-containing protein [Daldinia decipiens]KAI1652995.1 FAD-binding domain-containing protein [Daldinia decipiens]
MTARWFIGIVSLTVLIVAVGVHNSNYGDVDQYRSIPGDHSWPSEDDWNGLNQTVQGKLIANTPLAAHCHRSSLSGIDTHDQEKCDALRDAWFFPETHLVSPSSPMAYRFTNNSCNPFLDPDSPCNLGYYAEYTINAISASDLQAAVRFVMRHNFRLVIRNTGRWQLSKRKYGLAADQVLSWEVVTASGDLVIASPVENTDIFWALRGGGGSTYGIVVSMTVKAHPDTFFSAAYMNVFNDGNNTGAIDSSIGIFFQSLPSLVDAGAWVVWVVAPFGFMIIPAMVAGLHAEELDAYLQPTRVKMDQLGPPYQYSSAGYPGFFASYKPIPSMWNVSDFTLGGRLMPRELVRDQDSTDALVNAVRTISSQALMSGVSFNVTNTVLSPSEVAANPYFRKTLFSAVVGTPINYTDWTATKAGQDQITYKLLPELKALNPNGGNYLGEADFQEPDFKTTFYGAHYEKLLVIKQKYDLEDIFYAKIAVGSDRWHERADGRLCTKPSIWDFDVLNLIRRCI